MNRAWGRPGEGLSNLVIWSTPRSRPDMKCPVYGAVGAESALKSPLERAQLRSAGTLCPRGSAGQRANRQVRFIARRSSEHFMPARVRGSANKPTGSVHRPAVQPARVGGSANKPTGSVHRPAVQ